MHAVAQLSVSLPYRQVSVEFAHGKAVFNGASLSAEAGKPAMPNYLVSFILPPDAVFKNVKVTLENLVERELADTSFVHPYMPPRDENGNRRILNGTLLVEGKDTSIYNKNAYYPGDYKGNVEFGMMRQYKIVDIAINPYRWNPVTKKMRALAAGTIAVTVQKPVSSATDSTCRLSRCGWVEQILEKIAANVSALEYYGAAPPQPLSGRSNLSKRSLIAASSAPYEGYAIITTDKIKKNSTMLQQYADLLLQEGFTVTVLTEMDYGLGSTADACAMNIRKFLRSNYVAWNIHYVLLIGNPDPANTDMPDVPMKLDGGKPTDFCYADLTDASDVVDFDGEVVVGRIPVYPLNGAGGPNIAKLDKFLTKTIAYKKSTNVGWRRFALLPVVPLAADADDFLFGENIMNNVLKPMGWGYRRLYDPYNYFSFNFIRNIVNMDTLPEAIDCGFSRVVADWNAFKPGLVLWHTHGSSETAAGVLNSASEPKFSSVALLNDKYPAIVFSASCNNILPEDPYNLGSETLLYNAIAFIGGTRILGNFEGPGERYADNIVTYGMSVGMALSEMQATEKEMLINLYGCPEVSIGLSPAKFLPPKNLSVKAVSKSQINLSWSSGEPSYFFIVERGNENAGADSGFAVVAQVSGPDTGYRDTGLFAGTKYKYRVCAMKSFCSGYSPVDSASTFDKDNQSAYPEKPPHLFGYPYDNGADLYWAISDSGHTPESYNIKRSTRPTGPFVTIGASTENSFRCINLLNGTTYYFVVTAVNSFGQSEASNRCSVTPMAQPIVSAPSNLHCAAGETPNSLVVGWSDNSANELFFDVEYTYDNNILQDVTPFTRMERFPRNCTRASIGGANYPFENNSAISIRIRAGNDFGTGDYSSFTSGTTSAGTPPGAPVNFTATSPDPLTIKLHWAPAESTPKATQFQIFAKLDNGTDKFDVSSEVPASMTDSTFVTAEGTKMAFTIRAVYIDSTGTRSNSPYFGKISIATPVYACLAPSDFKAQALTVKRVRLTWADNSVNETGFCIERSLGNNNFIQIAQTDADAITFEDNNVLQDSLYYYRIRAIRSNQTYRYSPYSETISMLIGPPSVPSFSRFCQGYNVTTSSIDLCWIENSAVEGYLLRRASTYDDTGYRYVTIAALGPNVTFYSDIGLSPRTTYNYELQAFNNLGSASGYFSQMTLDDPNVIYNLSVISSIQPSSSASSEQSGYGAVNANDDDTATRWRASSSTLPQWWEIDLDGIKAVSDVEIVFEKNGTSGGCYCFSVETSVDDVAWIKRIDKSSNADTARTQKYPLSDSTQFVRMTIKRTPGNIRAGLCEFRVIGK